MAMGRPRNVDRAQVRSERVTVLLRPAVLDGLKLLAHATGGSVSDLLSSMGEALVKANAATIEKYADAQREAAEAVNMSVTFDVLRPEDANE